MSALFDRGFAVRTPAWHGLATVLADYPGREKAMELAGHNFDVIERPIFAFDPSLGIDKGLDCYSAVPGWKALIRSDSHAPIACQRQGYEVVQNATLWDIVDALVGVPNVRYETAGVLAGGAVLWVLAWLDEPVHIAGDDSATYPFVLVSTTHDGSGACKSSAVSIRVVCWNTYSAANFQSSKTGLEFTFKHSKNVMERIADAKAAIRGARVSHSDFVTLSEELAALPVTPAGVAHFLSQFIPEPLEKVCSDRVRENIREARNQVARLLEGRTIADAHRGTALGLFHAGVEYLDHLRGYRTSESYFRRCLFNADRQKKALVRLAQEAAAV